MTNQPNRPNQTESTTAQNGANPMHPHDKANVAGLAHRLYRNADRFVQADHASGAVTVSYGQLATVVHEILTDYTAILHTELGEATRESELRESEIITLTIERDRALSGHDASAGGVA